MRQGCVLSHPQEILLGSVPVGERDDTVNAVISERYCGVMLSCATGISSDTISPDERADIVPSSFHVEEI